MSNFKTSCVSRIFGKFAGHKFPKFFQNFINQTYVKMMHVDLSEFASSQSYESLNALFTRALLKQRPFEADEKTLISPCDAFISEKGKIEGFEALQIKGFSYRVDELLGEHISRENKEALKNGEYLNFYLSPKDYHRYHVPLSMRIEKAVHIPGKLYPVNFKWLHKVPNLFIENERVVLECHTMHDELFYMVFVGALNVGKMSFIFDKNIQTNAKSDAISVYKYENLWLHKGEELGLFEMGSTIVMFFEKEAFTLTCKENEAIKFAQTIGQIKK